MSDVWHLPAALGLLARPGGDPLSHPFVGQYPGRSGVSRPSSEWGRVGPPRCDHQVEPGARAAPQGPQRTDDRGQTTPAQTALWTWADVAFDLGREAWEHGAEADVRSTGQKVGRRWLAGRRRLLSSVL